MGELLDRKIVYNRSSRSYVGWECEFLGLVKRYNSWQGCEEMDWGRSERVHTMDSFERR